MYINKETKSIFLFQKLDQLNKSLSTDPINLEKVRRQLVELKEGQEGQNYDYLQCLLNPKTLKGVKVPTDTPTPSCSFQAHNSCLLKTNSSGFNATVVSPIILSSISAGDAIPFNGTTLDGTPMNLLRFITTLNQVWVLDDGGYNGDTERESIGAWDPWVDLSFTVPDVYDSFRVVSAMACLRYIGPIEEAEGVIGGAIDFSNVNNLSGKCRLERGSVIGPNIVTRAPSVVLPYSAVQNIRNHIYWQENSCLEGVQMLYFPLDNSFTEFKPVLNKNNVFCSEGQITGSQRVVIRAKNPFSGFNWVFYVYKGPQLKSQFKLEYWINYECKPKAEFLNYIPISLNIWKIPEKTISEIAKEVGKHAVKKIREVSAIDYFIA